MYSTANKYFRTRQNSTPLSIIDVFQLIATFLGHLEAVKTKFTELENQTLHIQDADPDFINLKYKPQLSCTLKSAFDLIIEACNEMGISSESREVIVIGKKKGESLDFYLEEFLERALELFHLMEDLAYTMLGKSDVKNFLDSTPQCTSTGEQVLAQSNEAINFLGEELKLHEDQSISLIDSGCYGSWLLNNWPEFSEASNQYHENSVLSDCTPHGQPGQ